MRKFAASASCIFFLIALALSPSAVAQVIPISNVEDLYTAVNDPAKAGATLALSPPELTCSQRTIRMGPRPKGGRIELQPDMSWKVWKVIAAP